MFHKINRICEKDFMMILFPKKMNATSEIILDHSFWIFLKINHFGILSPSLRRIFFSPYIWGFVPPTYIFLIIQ